MAPYKVTINIHRYDFRIVEQTCWHYAGGSIWWGPDNESDNQTLVLKMNESGTSGGLRLMNEHGTSFFVIVGVHNYKVWCDITNELSPNDTGMKVHPTYYSGGERSGVELVHKVTKDFGPRGGRVSVSLEFQTWEGNDLVADLRIFPYLY